MASEEVFVCGRCKDFEATTLEAFIDHMSKCVAPESKKKDDTNVECEVEILLDDSENSGDVRDTESPPRKKHKNSMVSSQFRYHSPTNKDGHTSPPLFIWSKQTAEFLFDLVKSHKEELQSTNVLRRVVWKKIAIEMEEKHAFCVSGIQCENKFKNMVKRYRQTKEYNSRPDRKFKKTCLLYNELEEYFENDMTFQMKQELKSNSRRKDLKSNSSMKHRKSLETPKYIDFFHTLVKSDEIRTFEGEDSINNKKSSQIGTELEKSYQNETEHEESYQNETEPEKLQETEHEKSHQNETEPLWVKRMMETFEKCHRESMKMQMEFINEFKKILEKT